MQKSVLVQNKVIIFLKDNIEEYLFFYRLGVSQDFLNQALTKMGNIDILNIIKIKNFCLSRDTVKWVQRQVTE